ncbi:4998_t:CDS:2 [Entrophospora sp. SA101]|nr:4998_t:CDS:2 [Entrophospora sp. SA101]
MVDAPDLGSGALKREGSINYENYHSAQKYPKVQNHCDAYVLSYKNELFLYKTSISPYRYASLFSKNTNVSQKPHKLLMKKQEIKQLITQIKTKHYNLIPLQVFINERG